MDSGAWDERYSTKDLVWSAGPNQFLPPLVANREPGAALDVACGEGRNAIWLAEHGWDVVGIDFSPVGIAKARKVAGTTNVHWEIRDVRTYEPGRTFDLVIVFYLHVEPDDLVSILQHVAGMLRPGGTLFGVGHAIRNLDEGVGGPPVPGILWSQDRLKPAVEGLNIIELGERLRDVPEADRPAIDMVVHAVRPQQ